MVTTVATYHVEIPVVTIKTAIQLPNDTWL